MQYIPTYACKQELCHVVGGNVWCAHQESLAQQTSYGRVFQEYKSRLITNRRYDDIIKKETYVNHAFKTGPAVCEISTCIK